MVPGMIDSIPNVAEFPFVERLPKREKSRFALVWEHFQALRRVIDEKGIPIQQLYAAKLLGVSRQRVSDLLADGGLQAVEVGGVRYVTESSLVSYAQSERKAGRPVKVAQDAAAVGVNRAVWAASKDYAKELVGVKK